MPEGVGMMRRLEFSLLPGTTALFRDFVDNFEQVADLYPLDPRRLMDGLNPERILQGRDFARQRLAEILQAQNEKLGCSSQTLANIELLKRPDTLAVITGQQVGLFTGPLFAIYKALTVLELARKLEARFPFRFVPLFWMASEDHDYQEVNHVTLLDKANRLITLQLRGDHRPGSPVGSLLLGREIESLLKRLGRLLPESEFKTPVLALLREAYDPKRTFSQAFGQTLLALFAEAGLVVVEYSDFQ